MKTKLFYVLAAALLFVVSASAATVNFTDDDVVQYLTINQTQSPAPGVELHFYLSSDGSTFTDMGIPPLGVEQVVLSNGTTNGFSNDTLYVQHTPFDATLDFWMFTQYEKFEPDLQITVTGAPSDTVHLSIVVSAIPAGEAIIIVIDK